MEKKKTNKKVKFSRFLVLILILSVLFSVFVISSFAAEVPTDLTGYDVYIPAGWSCSKQFGKYVLYGTCSIDGVDYDLRLNTTFNDFSIALGYEYVSEGGSNIPADTISVFYTSSSGSPSRLIVKPTSAITFNFTGGSGTTNQQFIQWLVDNNAVISEPEVPTIADSLTSVWTQIMSWIVSALSSVQAVFFFDGGLTFLGSLAIISVAIGLAFLLIAVISRFLSLRS